MTSTGANRVDRISIPQRTLFACLVNALFSASALGGDAIAVDDSEPQYTISHSLDATSADKASTATLEIPNLSAYTVDALRKHVPASYTGTTAKLVPIDSLYFLPTSNIIEMNKVWAASGNTEPRCILLSRGSYTLEMIRQQIADPKVLSKLADGSHLLTQPIYIAPEGALVLSGGDRLRLSTHDGTFIHSNGELIIVDSEVATWDRQSQDYDHRKKISKQESLLYARQSPRPYILAAEGSRTTFANSRFFGLGYKGGSGTYGISLASGPRGRRLTRYLRQLARPTAWIVGNNIVELFFGYYSNAATDVVVVGNLFDANVVYAIDPHDYSKRGLVARNVTQRSQLAHGIIFSRGVNNGWIAQNLSIGNAGSGIMLDRQSTDNRLIENLVFANKGDGIALFESDRNVLARNTVSRNVRNGIHVRNSASIDIKRNELSTNGRSGIELVTADISGLETRDFSLDPFRQFATANVSDNTFVDNGRSAVEMRSANAIKFNSNQYLASGPLYFSGDLQRYASQILLAELKENVRTVVKKGPVATIDAPAKNQHSGTKSVGEYSAATLIIRKRAEGGDPQAMVALARYHIKASRGDEDRREFIYWYARAIAHARVSAMSELGIYLLTGGARTPTEEMEGLVLLSLAAQLKDNKAIVELELIPHILSISASSVKAAYLKAASRLNEKRLWNRGAFPDISIRLHSDEAVQATKRIARLGKTPRRGSLPPRLDPQLRRAYEKHTGAKNEKRDELRNRLLAERVQHDQATGERGAYLDRAARRQAGARLHVKSFGAGEYETMIKELRKVLLLINQHRSTDAQLTLKDLNVDLQLRKL